jgi:hypothetical protein
MAIKKPHYAIWRWLLIWHFAQKSSGSRMENAKSPAQPSGDAWVKFREFVAEPEGEGPPL